MNESQSQLTFNNDYEHLGKLYIKLLDVNYQKESLEQQISLLVEKIQNSNANQ